MVEWWWESGRLAEPPWRREAGAEAMPIRGVPGMGELAVRRRALSAGAGPEWKKGPLRQSQEGKLKLAEGVSGTGASGTGDGGGRWEPRGAGEEDSRERRRPFAGERLMQTGVGVARRCSHLAGSLGGGRSQMRARMGQLEGEKQRRGACVLMGPQACL